MSRTGTVIIALFVLAAEPACFGPSFEPCSIQCGPTGTCPPGLACTFEGYCQRPGERQLCTSADDGGIRDGAIADAFVRDGSGPRDADTDAWIDTSDAGSPVSAGDLVITEIHHDPCALNFMSQCTIDDVDGEWFEIYNTTDQPLQLFGLIVSDGNVDSFVVSSSAIVGSHSYFVFGVNDDTNTNGGVTVDYQHPPEFQLANENDEVRLHLGGTLIDGVDYTQQSFPVETGRALSLSPASIDPFANDVGGAWCAAGTPYGDGDYGTPGAANPSCQ